jgi:phospholipid/cholesterol/gamma-HCH transport system substrate-binding protein
VRILSGAIALCLFSALVYFGLKVTSGAYRPVYYLNAAFDTAGQGLDPKSDVKVHGMNIGTVSQVTLVNGRALIRLRINKGQRVPIGSRAVIRPKTLFGEKFVDIDPGSPQHEAIGPFMKNGDRITNTLGGFELEQVLGKLYPVLKDVRPEDLTVVLDTLARGGQGEGPAINRQLSNWKTLADIGVAHDADTRQFLDDFALLSNELANRSGDLVAMAKSLNSALPPLNQRGDEVASVLANLSRLSNDFADVLDSNRPFQDKAVLEGGKTLDVLSGRAGEIRPLLVGVGQYLQFQAIVGHIPYTDGSNMAAVKLIAGGGSPCGQGTTCPAPGPSSPSAPPSQAPSVPPVPAIPVLQLPQLQTGANAVTSLLQGVL